MKHALLTILLLPLFSYSQSKFYLSADANANFGKFLEHTGFGLIVSGNYALHEKIYIGLSTGAVQVKPFIKNPAIPVSGRLTFFTSNNEEKIAPFGLFEVGKLFYKENNFGGSTSQTMEGNLTFFTGVGVKLVSQTKLHSFFSMGYSGYHYNNKHHSAENTVVFSKPYNYRRITLRVGLMLAK